MDAMLKSLLFVPGDSEKRIKGLQRCSPFSLLALREFCVR